MKHFNFNHLTENFIKIAFAKTFFQNQSGQGSYFYYHDLVNIILDIRKIINAKNVLKIMKLMLYYLLVITFFSNVNFLPNGIC